MFESSLGLATQKEEGSDFDKFLNKIPSCEPELKNIWIGNSLWYKNFTVFNTDESQIIFNNKKVEHIQIMDFEKDLNTDFFSIYMFFYQDDTR